MKVLKPEQFALPPTGSFTRASTATYVDEGLLKTANTNEPRWQDGRLLLEKAATNIILNSNLFTAASWVKTSCAITTGIADPFGGTLASTLTSSAANATMVATVTVASGTALAGSFWIRRRTGTGAISFRVGDANTLAVSITTDWQRIFVSSVPTTTSGRLGIVIATSGNAVDICFAQLEVGTKATSYIPTTTAAVTRSADVITGAGLIWTNATESTAAWSSGTTYSVGQKVRYLSKIYESLVGSNLNNTPNTSPLAWLDLGYDNTTRFLDNKVSTQTTRTANLRFIVATSKLTSVGLLELDAGLITMQVHDGATFDVTFQEEAGLSGAEVFNWYDYFFVDPLSEPIKQFVFDGIPNLYASNIVSVNLDTDASALAAIGHFIAGTTTEIGKTQYGLRAGIVDYSRKETDEFGTTEFVERAYSKRASAEIFVENSKLNTVQRFLYGIRATPVLWMASDDPTLTEAAYVYGFYRDFSSTISYPSVSMCSVEIEGLT